MTSFLRIFVATLVVAYSCMYCTQATEWSSRQYSEEPTATPTCTPSPEPWDWDTEKVYKNCESKCLLCYECEQVYQFPYFEFIQFLYNFGPEQISPTPTPSEYSRQSLTNKIRTYFGGSVPTSYSSQSTAYGSSNEYGYGSEYSSWGYGEGYTVQPTCSTAPQIPTFFKKCYWGCYGCLKCLLEYGYHFQVPTYVWSGESYNYIQSTSSQDVSY
eukprot:jgi/Galph1/2121/GphlegSOOS_G818.1